MDGAETQAARHQIAKLLDVVCDAAADAAKGEGRADDRREAGALNDLDGLLQRAGQPARRHIEADLLHRIAEQQAVFADVDRVDLRADQFDPVLRENPLLVQRHGEVERRLSADGRQHRVRTLQGDDRFGEPGGERLHVGAVRELRVRHDRGRVAVDQHDLEAFVLQRLAGLRARIVELRRLPDHDRAGADDENALEVGASGHRSGCRLQTAGCGLRQVAEPDGPAACSL